MAATRLGPRGLLEHDAGHGVLICRECKYAIQKSALRSHLLRHRIYRDERQRLLSAISQLDLFEPGDVPLPAPDSLPIEGLPVISGYRCSVDGCGNLCASLKRVAQHRREIHGVSEPASSSAAAAATARSVKLQTFFRGTKLRYFEVTPPSDWKTSEPMLKAADKDQDEGEGEGEDEDVQHEDNEPTTSLKSQQNGQNIELQEPTPTYSITSPKSLVTTTRTDLDSELQTLAYFHHFTTITSLTLPIIEGRQQVSNYWQTHVVQQALRQRWLMDGLLAISAHHLATLADNYAAQQAHREQSMMHTCQFLPGFEESTNRNSMYTTPLDVEDEVKDAGKRIKSLLHCVQWAAVESTPGHGILQEPVALESIMASISGVANSDTRKDGDCSHEQTLAQATRMLKMGSSPDAAGPPPCGNIPPDALACLVALPSRMVEALEKPEDGRNVLVALSAIGCLVECCNMSFASEETAVTWKAMATWLDRVPRLFHDLVSRSDPGTLVILTYWVVFLVKRAADRGCWFLEGMAKMVVVRVGEELRGHGSAVQGLVVNLQA